MAVTRISQSSLKQGLKKNKNFTAGIPPILGKFDSIATVTVGSGGASSIEFTSIPGTYQHLQIRGLLRDERTPAGNNENIYCEINSDSTGANYYFHALRGSGSSAAAAAVNDKLLGQFIANSMASANVFAGIVIDILDYANTSKNTTIRTLVGYDNNGSGYVGICSTLWSNTNAVTGFKVISYSGTDLAQYSTLALYGWRAP